MSAQLPEQMIGTNTAEVSIAVLLTVSEQLTTYKPERKRD